MKSRTLLSLVLFVLFAGASARAQTPLGDDLVIAAFPPNVQGEFTPQPVCDDAGVCGLFWGAIHNSPDNRSDIVGVALSPEGQLLTRSQVLTTVSFPNGPIAVGLERGFAVFWDNLFSDNRVSPILQYFDESLAPQGPPIVLPFHLGAEAHDPNTFEGFTTVVRTPKGFALYGGARNTPSEAPGIFIFFIDRNGKPTRHRQRLNEDISDQSVVADFNGLAVLSNGDLVAVYWRYHQTGDVYMRRLTSDGALLGPETLVNTERKAVQGQPAVATAPDGSFIVTWQRSPLVEGPSDIMARRFSAKGKPIGKPFQINDVHNLDQRQPVITADSRGNYFIAWQSFIPGNSWDIEGRLFRHDSTPVAGEISLNQIQDADQDFPQVAFTRNGTVIVGWESTNTVQDGVETEVPVVRVFATPQEP
jgi:hypothetical protein